MADRSKKLLVVLGCPISSRLFLESGIVRRLHEALPGRVVTLVTSGMVRPDAYKNRIEGIRFIRYGTLLGETALSAIDALRYHLDRWLDERFGFFPLSIRFNLRHRFNIDRMSPGQKNWYWNSDRIGPLPDREWINARMQSWYFSPGRFIHPAITQLMKDENIGGVVYSNPQMPESHGVTLAAEKLGIPVIGHIASWDHPVGKGVVYRGYRRYIAQNRLMRDALERYHQVDPAKVEITGWPQLDMYASSGSDEAYQQRLAQFGLDPTLPVVLLAANTETNAPFEPKLFERLLQWREAEGGRFSFIVRPHPKDIRWRERYASLMERANVFVQGDNYTDTETLALLLPRVACVLCTGGTVLLESIANDRPAVAVMYDEERPGDPHRAMQNFTMRHYEELMTSGAFYPAKDWEATCRAIESALGNRDGLREERQKLAALVVGEIDGGAVARTVECILANINVVAV